MLLFGWLHILAESTYLVNVFKNFCETFMRLNSEHTHTHIVTDGHLFFCHPKRTNFCCCYFIVGVWLYFITYKFEKRKSISVHSLDTRTHTCDCEYCVRLTFKSIWLCVAYHSWWNCDFIEKPINWNIFGHPSEFIYIYVCVCPIKCAATRYMTLICSEVYSFGCIEII